MIDRTVQQQHVNQSSVKHTYLSRRRLLPAGQSQGLASASGGEETKIK